jgi:hypothetical protein
MKIDQEALCKTAREKFGPSFWCRPGEEFGYSSAVFWTGESAIMPDGNGAVVGETCDWDMYPGYVHKDLEQWGEENGIFFEFYDNATLLGFEIGEE